MSEETPFPFADLALARRLERAEARGGADFVETRARLFPDSGARWIEVAGAYALFDGVQSPVTQTFGLGLFAKPAAADLERIEAFFRECGAPVSHEVSPLADPGLLALLTGRGYEPFELTSVLFRPVRRDLRLAAVNEHIRVRPVREDERELWARTSARGWAESPEQVDAILEFTRVGAALPAALALLAELDGRPVATAAMHTCEGVAVLAGASTVPEARKQGAQLALLEARLRAAPESGCDLAMMGALPGSASQRNAERHGFRIAYTRIKWRLPARGIDDYGVELEGAAETLRWAAEAVSVRGEGRGRFVLAERGGRAVELARSDPGWWVEFGSGEEAAAERTFRALDEAIRAAREWLVGPAR